MKRLFFFFNFTSSNFKKLINKLEVVVQFVIFLITKLEKNL